MENKFDLINELHKNNVDRLIAEEELNNYKKKFANELINGGVGNEINANVKINSNKPQKLKKPFKLRMKEKFELFKNKLKIVLGGEYGDR